MSSMTAPHELFFSRTLDPERAKKRYRALSLVLHPDIETGDTALMQRLNAEFDAFREGKLRPAQDVPPRTNNPPPQESYAERVCKVEQAAQRIITGLPLHLRLAIDFSVEASMRRIIAKGNTYAYKEDLKIYGFRWDPDNRVWYLEVWI